MAHQLLDILTEHYGLSEDLLLAAMDKQAEKGISIGEIIVTEEILSEEQWLGALSIMYNIPYVHELRVNHRGHDFTADVPIQFLKKFLLMPVETGIDESENNSTEMDCKPINKCLIAVHDPTVFQQIDDLVRILKAGEYSLVLSTKDEIISAINVCFDHSKASAEQIVQDMEEVEESSSSIINEIEETSDLLDDTSDAPLIKLVNHIISQSIKSGASDIHIEPFQNTLQIRYRIDGILHNLLSPPKHIQSALISRIKVMAKLNIAEKRLPQDGRIEVKKGEQDIDIRVSTIPTSFGERIVLRLLNKTSALMSLTDLGLESNKLEVLKKQITAPNGIILVTGPTGSGKTTTLYAVLSSINTTNINIITIEDPVEYQILGIGQIQVNPKIDLTFAKGLRAIVRQDPDVILIGEIRDKETADMAVRSALTGHLVFSTIHTNDSASTVTRLVDIGIEPFLISSSVNVIIAQRLIRVLCHECKTPFNPDNAALKSIGLSSSQDFFKGTPIYKAKGCEQCYNTGYKGRISIFEMMLLENELKKLILTNHDGSLIKEKAINLGMETLRGDGITKVMNGITSISEILRVTEK